MTPSPAPATSRLDASRWPASKIEMWPVADLSPYVKNARTHSQEQVDQIAASMERFGFTIPMLVAESGTIIAGHGRLMAAMQLGMAEVPVMIARGWSDEDRRLYTLADNRLAEMSEWDPEMLQIEWDELRGMGLGDDLDMIGFTDADLQVLLPEALMEATGGLTDEDAVPDAPAVPVTVLGDVWLLGRHRLMCGDSTSIDAVERLMDGRKADMCFTSPPYNADTKARQGDIFNGKKSVKLYSDGYADKMPSSEYVDFASSVLEICFSVTDGFIFWNVSYNAKSRFEYIQQINGRLSYLVEQICWKKSSTVPFKGSLMRDWEPIFVFSTNKQPISVKAVTSNFWQISNTGAQTANHKACFPVELPEKGIDIVSLNTGLVFDPFGGSGSTLIACEKTARDCRMMELDPKYCDVIIKRWQEYTGRDAVLEGSGETFAETMAARLDGEPEEDAA